MGATPLYLEIIIAQANAYSRMSVTLHLSSTVLIEMRVIEVPNRTVTLIFILNSLIEESLSR